MIEQRLPIISVALIASAGLAYEVLLMRLFSIVQWHHFAYMIISLALLGYGMSGTVLTVFRTPLIKYFNLSYFSCLLLFCPLSLGAFLVAQNVSLIPEELLWDLHQPLRLVVIYLLLSTPFLAVALAIGLALSYHQERLHQVYRADLLGAASGAVLVVIFLSIFFPENALRCVSLLGITAALFACWEIRVNGTGTHKSWPALALFVFIVVIFLPESWLTPRMSPFKSLSQTLQVSGTKVLGMRSSPLGLLTIVESQKVPFRYAPGLGLMNSEEPPEQLAIFTDGDAMTALNRVEQADLSNTANLRFLAETTSALPYHLSHPQNVLLLGLGGGTELLRALYFGAGEVIALELNPQMIKLLDRDFSEHGGNLLQRDNVTVVNSEGRAYLSKTHETYDLIQLVLTDGLATNAAGVHALNESYLYTTEALTLAISRLAPKGYLSITRWIKLPPRDSLKLIISTAQALKDLGIEHPAQHLILIRSWQTSTLVVKKSPIDAVEIANLKRFCEENAFDLAFYPGMSEIEANQYHQIATPLFFEGASALLGNKSKDFINHYKFNIAPASDNRPYFNHFFKWRSLSEIIGLGPQGGRALLESGYLIVTATLVQAIVLSALLILLPLMWLRKSANFKKNATGRGKKRGERWVAIYFTAIGLGFLFIEIAFLQRFLLYLHHPVYSVPVVLATFLVFAGFGSAHGIALAEKWGSGKTIALVGGGIALYCMSSLLILSPIFSSTLHWPLLIKIFVSCFLISPLAWLMGMPLPLAMRRLPPDLVPWAWGVNGCASVISVVLATLLAVHIGFSGVIIVAIFLYALSAMTLRKLPNLTNQV